MNRLWGKRTKRNLRYLIWLGVGLVSFFGAVFAQQMADKWIAQLPEGKGKVLVQDACVQCHTLQSTVVQRKDRTGWKKTVNDMILRGAFIMPNEAEAIVDYLSAALGPVKAQAPQAKTPPLDLNSASLEELLRATPLERAEAEAILEYRRLHGPFRSVDELKGIKALKPERFEKIKAFLAVPSTEPKVPQGSSPTKREH